MKKRMLLSLAVIALAAGLIGGGTLAWFTDQVALDEPEEFGAGTLMVDIEDFEADPEGIAQEERLEDVQPGDEWEYDLEIRNDGTLDYEYRVMMFWMDETGQELEKFEDDRYDGSDRDDFGTDPLSEVIEFTITDGEDDEVVDGETLADLDVDYGDDQEYFIPTDDEDGYLFEEDAENREWNIKAEFPEEAGNEYQGSELEFMVKISARQVDDDSIWAEYDHPYGWAFDLENDIQDVEVDYGTSDDDAIDELADEVVVRDTELNLYDGDENDKVALDWTLEEEFDGYEEGNYEATASIDTEEIDENYPDEFDPDEAATATVTVGPQPEIGLDVDPESVSVEEDDSFALEVSYDEDADVEVSYDDELLEKDNYEFTAIGDAPAETEIDFTATMDLAEAEEVTVKVDIVEEVLDTPLQPMVQEYEWDEDIYYDNGWYENDEEIDRPDDLLTNISTNIDEGYDFEIVGADSSEVEAMWLYSEDQEGWLELKEPCPVASFLGVESDDVTVEDGVINISEDAVELLETEVNALSEAVQVGAPIMPEVQFEGQEAPGDDPDDAFNIDPEWDEQELIDNALDHDRVPFINFVVPHEED